MPKLTADAIRGMKSEGRRIAMLTAYDYPTAQFAESAGVDVILVGDSLGMVVLGFKTTRDITMDIMATHVGAARRGAPGTHIVGDLPVGSYPDPATAVGNARRLIDAGADSVKIEGALPDIVRAIRAEGIDVVGHVGVLPQTTGTKIRGRDPAEALAITDGARVLESAGCFAVVLENVVQGLGEQATASVGIPTIGIGAGPHTDGQVLIMHDILGMFPRFTPPFAKRYADLGDGAIYACRRYADEVRAGVWPDPEHSRD